MLHTIRFSFQNAVYFIMLPFWFLYYSHLTYRVCQNLNVKLRCQKVNVNLRWHWNTIVNIKGQCAHRFLASLQAHYLWNYFVIFKVCKSVHHRTIQINHQPHATIFQFIILTFIHSSTCFGRFSRPSSGAQWLQRPASGFTFVSWWQSCCIRVRADRPDHEHSTTVTTIWR